MLATQQIILRPQNKVWDVSLKNNKNKKILRKLSQQSQGVRDLVGYNFERKSKM